MPKATNQKIKLLVLMDLLNRQSDEKHPISVPEMVEALAARGIAAERKSVYDDLEALRLYGMDIELKRGREGGYYVAQRDFELPELKLLVDSIQSSKFITQKKTLALIRKLENLASVHDAQLLERQVYVRSRVKSMNESVYYNVDEIAGAISGDRAIRFRYFDLTLDKKRAYRREGRDYEVSPFALLWDDENYYLLGWDDSIGELRHYRVDRMASISALERERQGKAAFAEVEMSAYTQKVFGMFNGRVQRVKLRFARHLAGAVFDRFGRDAMLVPESDGEHFTVTAEVAVSTQFFGWLFGFGDEAEILEPEDVRQQLLTQAKSVSALYEKEAQP